MDHDEQAIVLFYKYFSSPPSQPAGSAIQRWWKDPKENVRKLYEWHEENLLTTPLSSENNTCTRKRRLPLVGRILIAPEGINGTLSGNRKDVEEYVERMKSYDGVSCKIDKKCSDNERVDTDERATTCYGNDKNDIDLRIFRDVDYKLSYESSSKPLFPDLKISIVKEIVSTSGLVDVHDVPLETGKHLTPEEFHEILEESKLSKSSPPEESSQQPKEIALIDVRNTFEHDIGYFVDPKTNTKAIDPETTTFSSFDKFCERNADELRNKKVMMYCTGGIRCEKASILLKRRGVEDVNQLSGGIHRYLEQYGNAGHFKGLNFTFDKRVAMKPNFAFDHNENGDNLDSNQQTPNVDENQTKEDYSYEVVGRCVECDELFDELCGSRVCTVCRDLVLVCDMCRSNGSLREYHCKRHCAWKKAYFSFLEIFDADELKGQRNALLTLRDEPSIAKNVRRTLTRQINKVDSRIRGIEDGSLSVDRNAPRRCRSCQEPLGEGCDGKCWGFWRKAEVLGDGATNEGMSETHVGNDSSDKGSEFTTALLKPMRGRRAKQKREAELQFLQQRSQKGAVAC
jgi:predicted sulfurtransferase